MRMKRFEKRRRYSFSTSRNTSHAPIAGHILRCKNQLVLITSLSIELAVDSGDEPTTTPSSTLSRLCLNLPFVPHLVISSDSIDSWQNQRPLGHTELGSWQLGLACSNSERLAVSLKTEEHVPHITSHGAYEQRPY